MTGKNNTSGNSKNNRRRRRRSRRRRESKKKGEYSGVSKRWKISTHVYGGGSYKESGNE